MKKLTDQELDSIFKAAAEGIKPEYDGTAWEGMNARLNALAKPQSIINRWLPLSLLGLIIFFTGVWIGSTLTKNSPKDDGEHTERKMLAGNQDLNSESLTKKSLSDQHKTETGAKSLTTNLSEKNTQPDSRVNGVMNDSNPIRKGHATKNGGLEEKLLTDLQEINLEGSEKLTNGSHLQSEVNSQKVLPTESKNDSVSLIRITKQEPDSTSLVSEPDENKKEEVPAKGIFIRALASPDFSSVNFGSANSAGSNYALLVEYQFNTRWSVATGAIRSFKKYSSTGEITYSGYTADKIDGTCRILDVPITLYYRLNPTSKTSLYGGVGLSSYLMLSEDYTFTKFSTTGDREFFKQVERENNEWFKVLNLSIGVQRQIGSRMYVQAEPFIKAPLAGMGYGEVRLSSLGVFFGVKYKLY